MILIVVGNSHKFHSIDVLPKGGKFDAEHYISDIYNPYPEFLLLLKMTQGDILWFRMTMPELIVAKLLFCFSITIPYAEHLILLIR
jgi:hypothetical protein